MKKFLAISLVGLALGFSGTVWAAEETTATVSTFREQRMESREEIMAARENWEAQKEEWRTERQEVLDNLRQQKEEFKKLKEKFTEERCARIQERLQNREANFEEVKEKHLSVYANLVERINKFLDRFKEKGLSTTTLETHLADLESRIEKFKDDYAAYEAKLQGLKGLTCGHAEGEFKAGLLETKTLLKTVHADAADIRTFVRETILADIKALKAQMPKAEEKAAEVNETEDEANDDQE